MSGINSLKVNPHYFALDLLFLKDLVPQIKFKTLFYSVFPDRTEEILSVSKSLVVLDEVKERSTDDCEVEDLMARSTVVKSSWLASLWTPDHIKDRSLDIDVASECVAPAPIRCYVFLHKLKHDEHHPT